MRGGDLAVKHIHRYIYKGNGSITLHIALNAGVFGTYLTALYIGPVPTPWGLFAFSIHQEKP